MKDTIPGFVGLNFMKPNNASILPFSKAMPNLKV